MSAITHSLRKRFIKDYSIPITLVQDPYFDYFIKTYDPLFNSLSSYKEFERIVELLGGEEGFFSYAKNLNDSVIEHVKGKPAYKEFQSRDNFLWKYTSPLPPKLKNVYTQENKDKLFISIDLVKANFQSLKTVAPSLVDNAPSYLDFISSFTEHEYFKNSKQIRQVIFGNLNPKRQQNIQKWIINEIVSKVTEEFDLNRIKSTSSDEIVLETNEVALETNEKTYEKDIKCLNQILEHVSYDTRTEAFELKQLGDKSYFVKESLTGGNPVFKAVPSHFFAQSFKYYFNLPLEEWDFYTFHDGLVVEYKQGIY